MPRGSLSRKCKATQIDDTFGDATTPNNNVKKRVIRRKKQGVTKTNSAAVKALIRLNQTNSPLLKIAPEIREKILTYLVSGQVLHLFKTNVRNINTDVAVGNGPGHGGSSRAAVQYLVCQADSREIYNYHDRNVGETMTENSALYYVEDLSKRHDRCRHVAKIKEERQKFRLSLNILGVGRQLYEEANHLLWSTNTFTFDEPVAFELFLGSLNLAQKRNLTKLSFFNQMDLDSRRKWDSERSIAFRPASLNMLQGLTTLTLCFHQIFAFGPLLGRIKFEDVKRRFWENMEAFIQFRMLPLKRVFVTITDDDAIWLANEEDLISTNGEQRGRWTAAQKNQFALEWEEKLLDADPVSTIAAEEDAKELEDREADIRFWNRMIKSEQRQADIYKTQAAAAAEALEEAKSEPKKISCSMQVSIECTMKTREEAVVTTNAEADAAMLHLQKTKARLPIYVEEEAAKRQAERELRKRRQVTIIPTARPSIRPATS